MNVCDTIVYEGRQSRLVQEAKLKKKWGSSIKDAVQPMSKHTKLLVLFILCEGVIGALDNTNASTEFKHRIAHENNSNNTVYAPGSGALKLAPIPRPYILSKSWASLLSKSPSR